MKILAYISTLSTVISFLFYTFFVVKMSSASKDGRHLFRREVGFNPFYSFYRPELLSSEGQVFRSRAGYCFLLFVGFLAASLFLWSTVLQK
jgi:hypothetical protein